jgi:FkbM family methyltransferase
MACVILLVLVAGFLTGRWFVLTRHETFVSPRDVQWLRDRFGPEKWSENVEEWIVRDFFNDARDGVFLDVGSADARVGSNTYYLESQLGWSGVAVDALEEYASSYERLRPRTKFFALFAGDHSDERATIYVAERFEQYSSSARAFTAGRVPGGLTARAVPSITLSDLLTRAGINRLDFMSMDIELSEPQALAGFDLRAFSPRLVCVEAHPSTRQAILDYFTTRGYVVAGKYLRLDQTNLWFMPLAAPPR